MGRRSDPVTAAEQQVLEVLWDHGETTIRAITDRLHPGGGASRYATVQKLLDRLRRKGCVRVRRGGRANRYRAAIDREALIGRQVSAVADRLGPGSLAPVLAHLIRARRLSAEDRAELRRLLASSAEPEGEDAGAAAPDDAPGGGDPA